MMMLLQQKKELQKLLKKIYKAPYGVFLFMKRYRLLLMAYAIINEGEDVLMKKSQCCPKCQSRDILYVSSDGVLKRNAYHDVIVDYHKLKVEQYICKKCGFIESYVRNQDLKKLEKM